MFCSRLSFEQPERHFVFFSCPLVPRVDSYNTMTMILAVPRRQDRFWMNHVVDASTTRVGAVKRLPTRTQISIQD